jgi:hypothetical protein
MSLYLEQGIIMVALAVADVGVLYISAEKTPILEFQTAPETHR